MDKENVIRYGIATKGFVYILLGGLTVLAAAGMGGKKSVTNGVLDFLSESTIGQMLLAATAVGLAAYVFWRFYQTFGDPEGKGNDAKGIGIRIGYFSSGIIYGILAFSAVELLFGSGSGSNGGGNSMISKALSQRYGQWIVGIIACIYLGKAIYQIYRAYSGEYRKKIQEQHFSDKTQKLMVVSGIAGYTARGIVIGIIAYLTFRAAFRNNSNGSGGTSEAFDFLQNEFGALMLGIIALGLLLYGVYTLINARHRRINV
ncbi:MAG TPA: DUF1206 domain-containing protein [Mariniphaga sp.]|nr:DUF1206 domain-containing protein [Mariniphaga sp.]